MSNGGPVPTRALGQHSFGQQRSQLQQFEEGSSSGTQSSGFANGAQARSAGAGLVARQGAVAGGIRQMQQGTSHSRQRWCCRMLVESFTLPHELGLPQGSEMVPNENFAHRLVQYIWVRSFVRSLMRLYPVLGVCICILNAVANWMEGHAFYAGAIRAFSLFQRRTILFFVIQCIALGIHGFLYDVPVAGSWNAVRTKVARLQHSLLWPGCLSWTFLPILSAWACQQLSVFFRELCAKLGDPDVPVPFSSLLKQEGCVDGTTAWLLVLGGTTGLLHGIQFHYFQDYLLRFTRFERRTLVQIRDETPGVIDSSMRVTVGAMAVVTVMEIVLLYLDWNLSAVLVLGSGCLALYLINRVLKASWLPTPAGRMSIPFVCLAAAFVILATAWKQDTSIEISQQVVASNLVVAVFIICWLTAFGFKFGALIFRLQFTQLFMLNIPDAQLPTRGFGREQPTESSIITMTARLADGYRVPFSKWLALRRLANLAEFSSCGRQQIFDSGQIWQDVTRLCCDEVERLSMDIRQLRTSYAQAQQKVRHFGRLSSYVSWLNHGQHEDALGGAGQCVGWAIETLSALFYYGYTHRQDRHGLGVRLQLKDSTPNLHVGEVLLLFFSSIFLEKKSHWRSVEIMNQV